MNGAAPTPAPLGLLVRRWPERRRIVLGTVLLSLLAVLAAVLSAEDPELGLAFLAVVPIALAALELGRRCGLVVAGLAFAAVLPAAAYGPNELGMAAIGTRGLAFLAVASIAGHFSDRMRAAHEREESLLRSGLRLGEASRRDQLSQIAAGELMRTPGVVGATVGIDGLADTRTGVQDGTRVAVPMLAHGVHVGTLEAFLDSPPGPEDLAAVKLLARQVAILSESLRLLDLHREHAAMEARLRGVRRELIESRSGTGALLRAEEAGKRRAAEKLHEDLAQVLSAVLIGMRMLERGQGGDANAGMLEGLHRQVAQVLGEIRDVARDLRPVVLDQLGLVPALKALARDGGEASRLQVGALPDRLPEAAETAVYRLVEDALALGAAVTVQAGDGALEIAIEPGAPSPDAVLALRARAETAGGTLTECGTGRGGGTLLRATVPVG